ncbi:lysoplasmalogenase [Flavobacteriales bacterium]|nr:lysoplasmalogenase [Flavobacteriales bacterium]
MSRLTALIIVYFLVAIAEIIGTHLDYLPLIFATKPLLMVTLFVWFYLQTEQSANNKYRKYLLLSIVFACGGDTFLMFLPFDEIFFLLGLGSFLIGQLFYVFAFSNSIKDSKHDFNKPIGLLLLILFMSYYALLMYSLFPYLEDFLMPVLVYGVAVCAMGVSSGWRLNKVSNKSFTLVFVGAMLFVLSDTIIAVNQFLYKGNLLNAQVSIMITYVLGQYLIAKGSVKYLKEL